MQAVEQSLWEHLKKEAEELFGFKVMEHLPINRGWLNQKWKVETDQGTFLIKQYNPDRLKKYDLKTIQLALQTQNRAFSNGIPCPKLLEHRGQLLHRSSKGELFTVMRYMDGNLIKAGEAIAIQMESMGKIAGKLHKLLNDGTLPRKTETMFQIPTVEERLSYWDSVLAGCKEKGLEHILPLILLQKETTNKIDISELKNLPSGWCHRDLWVDNLLFSPESVTAILDFDRLNYDFIHIDVARVVLSTCLKEDGLNIDAVHAFVKGYSYTNELTLEMLVRSLKLVWYLESIWWISVEMGHQGEPPKRFAKEMLWLAENSEDLETILLGNK
jgi:homoserine kinase type II